MIQTLYRGSVKDLKGPLKIDGKESVIFEYTDAYSVFDWGRMPDPLARKGEALAVLAADWFEKLEQAESWKEFSKSIPAQGLRKQNRFGSSFNEIGEELQEKGLRTHYLGAVAGNIESGGLTAVPTRDLKSPTRTLAVGQVSVVKPTLATVLGRSLPDYQATRLAPAPRLVPLEVVFRFSLPEGSSLFERVERDAGYLASLGYADLQIKAGETWDFPILELFTKLESSDRPVPLTEALSIAGLTANQLQDLLFRTAWVASWLRWRSSLAGVELADGKLEWALGADGRCFLVDAIGPDELRLLVPGSSGGRDGVQLSKEFLRQYYRTTPWYEAITQAKEKARAQGIADWKRGVQPPPPLPAPVRELGSQLYLSLANSFTGRTWFADAWGLERVVDELRRLTRDLQGR